MLVAGSTYYNLLLLLFFVYIVHSHCLFFTASDSPSYWFLVRIAPLAIASLSALHCLLSLCWVGIQSPSRCWPSHFRFCFRNEYRIQFCAFFSSLIEGRREDSTTIYLPPGAARPEVAGPCGTYRSLRESFLAP